MTGNMITQASTPSTVGDTNALLADISENVYIQPNLPVENAATSRQVNQDEIETQDPNQVQDEAENNLNEPASNCHPEDPHILTPALKEGE